MQQQSIAICNPNLVNYDIQQDKKLDIYKGVDILRMYWIIKMEPEQMQGS